MRPKPSGMGYTIPPWKKDEYAAQHAEIEAMRKAEKERKKMSEDATSNSMDEAHRSLPAGLFIALWETSTSIDEFVKRATSAKMDDGKHYAMSEGTAKARAARYRTKGLKGQQINLRVLDGERSDDRNNLDKALAAMMDGGGGSSALKALLKEAGIK